MHLFELVNLLQATLLHPEVAAAKANRDYVFKRVQNALDKISNAVKVQNASVILKFFFFF